MRATGLLFLALGALTALSAGCGADISDVLPDPGSCNLETTSSCTDYTGSAWNTPSSGRNACAQVGMGAAYSSSPCRTSSRVGSCRVNGGMATEIVIRSYGPRLDANTARAACTATSASATFTPG